MSLLRPMADHDVIGRVKEHLDELAKRFANLGDLVDQLLDLHRHAARAHMPFFEHRSLIVLKDGKPQLVGMEAPDVNAWRCHMSDGSSVRMRALEAGCAAELAAGRMISAMATARAHMEVAGLASYCCRALYAAGHSGDFGPVGKLIVQTYFGSNMRIQVKGTPALDPHLRPEEVRPLRIGELIKSMDDFRAAGQNPGTRCQVAYGILSEYAHPVMRATTASFTDVLAETADGWEIRYHDEHRLGEGEARMALEALLDNMRIGHACATLLNSAEVKGDGGALRLQTPSPEEAHNIYVNLLQQTPQ